MTIGKRIRIARDRLDPQVKAKQIADLFGITVQAVSEWERDESEPSPDKYPALRNILRVTFAWLIDGEGDPPAPNDHRVLLDDAAQAEWDALRAKNATPLKLGT